MLAMEVDKPQQNEEIEATMEWLGKAGIEMSLAESLIGNIMAQILVDQLIDKVESLQEELTGFKCTMNSLTSWLVGMTCKQHASPTLNSSDNNNHHSCKFRDPEQVQHDQSPIPSTLEITT